MLAGLLVALVGSGVLGVALLRRGHRPRATGWLLVAWSPLFVLLSATIALGAAILPIVWAWALAGRRLARTA